VNPHFDFARKSTQTPRNPAKSRPTIREDVPANHSFLTVFHGRRAKERLLTGCRWTSRSTRRHFAKAPWNQIPIATIEEVC
jgi:hypothetical protein